MFTAEENKACFRNAEKWRSTREFVMPFVDAIGQEAFKLKKTRSVRADICCHALHVKCCNYDND